MRLSYLAVPTKIKIGTMSQLFRKNLILNALIMTDHNFVILIFIGTLFLMHPPTVNFSIKNHNHKYVVIYLFMKYAMKIYN